MKGSPKILNICIPCLTFKDNSHSQDMAGTPDITGCPIRVGPVEGCSERYNEIIYHPPMCQEFKGTVIFFGGDMQDYKENMLAHRDNKNYVEWDLENSAIVLHQHFLNYGIVVVKPSKMSLKTFSCYENFVEVNNFGAPTYCESIKALKHLKLLLQNLTMSKNVSDLFSTPLVDKQIILIGFSKGCVVLNQLLYSLHSLPSENNPEFGNILQNIKDIYWIEGGHSGPAPTWVTEKSVLESFSKLNIVVHIHVTPYQVQCDTRPRIGKEEKIFRDTLAKLGVEVRRKLHFESEPRSLELHFKVLKCFYEC